jgi:pimeloyl-ACP methyl ester carboxylesterase
LIDFVRQLVRILIVKLEPGLLGIERINGRLLLGREIGRLALEPSEAAIVAVGEPHGDRYPLPTLLRDRLRHALVRWNVSLTSPQPASRHREFVTGLDAPLHVVAHDFGAWVAYSWALQFKEDFKSLALIDAGIPGVTLSNDIQLSDYKRKWNFIFQMLPDMPAELTKGKEDVYVGWWFKNKVFRQGAISPHDVAGYVRAYARKGRMDAAFDYCRKIVEDMEFNAKHFNGKLSIPLLAVGGDHCIPTMGESLQPSFEHVTSVVVPESGHFVPEEQPDFLAKSLLTFLGAHARAASDRNGVKS